MRAAVTFAVLVTIAIIARGADTLEEGDYEFFAGEQSLPTFHVKPEDLPLSESAIWQTDPFCGANCLYVFLNLLEVEATVDQVRRDVGTMEDEASLDELRDVARNYGVDADILRRTPQQLQRIPPPFIALMSVNRDGGGHFILVLEIEDGNVAALDGTSGQIVVLSPAAFSQHFSEYVLVPQNTQENSERNMLLIGLRTLVAAQFVVLGILIWRSRSRD